MAHGRQDFLVAAHVVNQTTRRGNDDLCAIADGFQLRAHRRATVDRNHVHAGHLLGVGFEGAGHLQGQLAGWRQDQGLWLTLGRVDTAEDRQSEGGGFAGAGLGLADHVFARQDHRDRHGLNRRRLFIARGDDGGKNIGVKFECGEAADYLGHGSASSASAKNPCSKAAHAV